MSDSFEEQGWVRLGVSTALAKEYGSDQRGFFQILVKTLSSTLPDETKLTSSGWFSSKKVVRIDLDLGEYVYGLEDPGRGNLVATRKKIVRGIALKTDSISVPDWLSEISDALELRAKTSETVRNALGNMLGLG